jgi:hypothetical protein
VLSPRWKLEVNSLVTRRTRHGTGRQSDTAPASHALCAIYGAGRPPVPPVQLTQSKSGVGATVVIGRQPNATGRHRGGANTVTLGGPRMQLLSSLQPPPPARTSRDAGPKPGTQRRRTRQTDCWLCDGGAGHAVGCSRMCGTSVSPAWAPFGQTASLTAAAGWPR